MPEKTIEELGIDEPEKKEELPKPPEPPKLILGKFKDEQEAIAYLTQLEQQTQQAIQEIAILKQRPQEQPPPQKQNTGELTSDTFWDDPVATTRKLTQEQLSQGAKPMYEAMTNITKFTVKTQLPDYEKYEKDIEEMVSKLSPDQQINPEVYKMAYQMALGKEAMANRIKPPQPPHLEPPSAGGDPPPEYNLTREQKLMAKSFAMSEKEYAESLQNLDIRTA